MQKKKIVLSHHDLLPKQGTYYNVKLTECNISARITVYKMLGLVLCSYVFILNFLLVKLWFPVPIILGIPI